MLIVLSLITILITCLYFYYKDKYSFWSKQGVKNLKPTLPFGSFGENLFAKKSFADIIDTHYTTFKNERYFGVYMLTTPILIVKDEELIKQITVKDFDHFVDHQNCVTNEDVDPLWSKNIFAMIGESWKKMRSTLSPAFTGNKMRYMFPLMNNVAEKMIQSLKKKEGLIKLEMKDTFAKVANDTIASCALGVECNSIDEPNNEFFQICQKAFDFAGIKRFKFLLYSSYPKIMKFFGLKLFEKKFSKFIHNVINESIELREGKGIERHDIITLLLKARKGEALEKSDDDKNQLIFKEYLTNDYITAQASIFYLGGFDTILSLLSFMVYNLVTHPKVQERLRTDIDDALIENKGEFSYDLIQRIKYLDLVFNETVRLYSQATFLDRLCVKEYTIKPTNESEKPLVIKPGQVIYIPTYSIHRDSRFYDNPYDFNPERDLSKSLALGFGNGPRACIGQRFASAEIKTVICHLLKNFEIVTVEETQIPIKLSVTDIPLTPESGVWVGFKRREE